jgi:glycosyltransferase involved in cell wall biosynthesis
MYIEIALFLLYLLAGPCLWILFSIGMASSRRRMNILAKASTPIPEPPPHVTIIVPAKDEAARIQQCLESILAQDYPAFDVIAVDDRSGDDTGRVMDALAAADPRLKAMHIDHLPEGWTGKNNALYQAAAHAGGTWLLFIDSDVILQPTALSATLRVANSRRYEMLSLILRQETRGMWESALVPLASAAFGAAFMMGLSNSESNRHFFGNGQFMLFQRAAYDQIGGHEAVKSHYNEDMMLARILKQEKLRPRIAWGTDLGAVRMYDSLAAIMRGWSRIFFGSSSGSPWRSLLVMFFILIGCYSCFAAAGWGVYRWFHPIGFRNGIPWLVVAAAHWLVMTLQIGVIYRWMRAPAYYSSAFLITGGFLMAILLRAVWMCITGRVSWRGTSYSHRIRVSAKS